ncbi:hypothetical protein FBU30_007789 [Linnemannia zychae]|nr:hypothetical protein FBU30_007789 [Linnemannia zychae]
MAKLFTSLFVAAALAVASLTSAVPVNNVNTTITDEPEVKIASNKFTGKATWFTDSYGSCNVNWNGFEEPIVALNAHQMGPQGWGNPECGKRVEITNKSNGKTVRAIIVDKCPGDECAFGSLDLSPKAFQAIGDLKAGVLNIEWNYV